MQRFSFTYNNPSSDWVPPWDDTCAYMVWQKERGAEGTEHFQGYVRFKKKMRWNAAKKWFRVESIHVEKAKGTEGQNRDYCTKEDTRIDGPWELGKFKETKQGQRSDLERIADSLIKGSGLKEVAIEDPGSFMRYHSGIVRFSELVHENTEIREVYCLILWGRTGVGKTHRIRTRFPGVFEVINSRDPWGKYNGQKEIVFDEFDWKAWSVQDMNRYCDKWSCNLDARYNNKDAKWNKVFIIGNTDPMTWWSGVNPELREAFFRRVSVIEIKNREQEINLDGI